MDLTDQPLILQIPEFGDRSYWFPIGDIYHNLVASISWDTAGPDGGAFALCPPTFHGLLPDGVERVPVTTPFVWTLGRYTVYDEDDVAAVNALQDATHVVPLDQWGSARPKPDVDVSRYPDFTFDGLTDPAAFFTVLNEMLRRNPRPQDSGLLAWFREINLHPEQRFDWEELDADVRDGLTRAVETGHRIVKDRTTSFAPIVNWWVEAFMDADMSDVPVNHAGAAMMGLLYAQKEASSYHVGYFDSRGDQLNGAHRYRLTFDTPPPVDAFWSVTIYSAATRQYVTNPIDRYAIGDRTPGLSYGEDGSLTILIQHEQPDDTANWLPAPAEPFYLALREYSPGVAILNRSWLPPAVERQA
jgi:hypothetical protein